MERVVASRSSYDLTADPRLARLPPATEEQAAGRAPARLPWTVAVRVIALIAIALWVGLWRLAVYLLG
ncbi:hypothetical protein [Limobrevibacterium gyesilva]|uniref:Uncharacterized protein n=1 Tax=Limobrevibacterium gyesilva TaxID=2991712 RepID=A0AA42CJK7_9PROT|nr:hypothetical protein [Limobrevibacterium gyesilva]MCW3477002.1 hypothetical protein [Limobrevibacterium gyesilva]